LSQTNLFGLWYKRKKTGSPGVKGGCGCHGGETGGTRGKGKRRERKGLSGSVPEGTTFLNKPGSEKKWGTEGRKDPAGGGHGHAD